MSRENEIIDLRVKNKGCTNHPVVRFTNIIKRISNSRENKTYTILFNEEDIPLTIAEKYVKKYNMRILEIKRIEDDQISILVKAGKQ